MSNTSYRDTMWDQLSPEDRASWLQEQPEAAGASRDGASPAAVSLRQGVAVLAQRRAPSVRELPAELKPLDRAALAFWFSLSEAERQRSEMRPDAALARLAAIESRGAAARPPAQPARKRARR